MGVVYVLTFVFLGAGSPEVLLSLLMSLEFRPQVKLFFCSQDFVPQEKLLFVPHSFPPKESWGSVEDAALASGLFLRVSSPKGSWGGVDVAALASR